MLKNILVQSVFWPNIPPHAEVQPPIISRLVDLGVWSGLSE